MEAIASLAIELGWEKLWEANCDLTANFALSTQQTADFLVDMDFDMFNDFPDINTTVEKVLVEAEAAGLDSLCSPSDPASTNPPLPTMPTSAACTRSREACVQRTSANCVYGLPKSDKDVARVIVSGIPQKTKLQTDRTVRVWEQWAESRNSRFSPGEKPFSAEFGMLTRSEMQFWLCCFVLETQKANGEPYNPNTLYQICCGRLRHFHINCNRNDANFLDDREFQTF